MTVPASHEAAGPTEHATGRWWEDKSRIQHHWYGVFKGGGAKGVVYGGALEAVEAKGCWFTAVAGSSAGALTAAVIAAGLTPDQIRTAVPAVLGMVRPNRLGRLLAGSTPLYSIAGVTGWLRRTLVEQTVLLTGRPRESPTTEVTFAELFAASGIDLYVVVMDLATSHPVVLSHHTTPDCEVAAAVAASCAIPVGFTSGRLIMRGNGDEMAVHRVVDGGAWANYPQFVFKDRSFREYSGLAPLPKDAVIVGFVLERGRSDTSLVPWGFRYDLSTDELEDAGLFIRGGAGRFALKQLDKTRWRLLSLVLWPLVMCIVTGWWLVVYRDRWEPIRAGLDDWIGGLGMVILVGTYAYSVLVLMALALGAYFIGREVIRVGIGAVIAALSVSTDVPPWLGTASGDWVVRVPVPGEIGTSTFSIPPSDLERAVDRARDAAADQIVSILGGVPTSRAPARRIAAAPTELDVDPSRYNLASREALCMFIFLLSFVVYGILSLIARHLTDETSISPISVVLLGLFLVVPLYGIAHYASAGADRRYLMDEEARRAARSAESTASPLDGSQPSKPTVKTYRRRIGWRSFWLVVTFAIALAISQPALAGLTATTTDAVIVHREDVTSDTFSYVAEIKEGPKAGAVYRFGSNVKVAPRTAVRLRWVGAPRGLEFASEVQTTGLFGAVMGTAIAVMLLLGIAWARSDLRRLREVSGHAATPTSNSPRSGFP